jgi:hypothetical protein
MEFHELIIFLAAPDYVLCELHILLSIEHICKRRLQRIETALKGAKASEKELHLKEQVLLQKIKAGLENEIPIYQQSLTQDEIKA